MAVVLLSMQTARCLHAEQKKRQIGKDKWPPNSPDLNPLDYHVWGAMLERYKPLQPKPNTIDELKKVY